MKRLNYYQVHKNKKPRNKKKVYRFNYFKVMMALTTAISASQLRIIISQPIKNKAQKALYIAEHCIKQVEVIKNISKEHNRQKYLKRVNIKK